MAAVVDFLTALISPQDWLVLAASAAVVLFMVVVGAMLGFRKRDRIDEPRLRALAGAEGRSVTRAIVTPRGDAGVAWLEDGRVLAARAMADGVSARIVQAKQVSARGDRVRVASNDLGFPTLTLRLRGEAPAWLSELARG